MEIISTQLIWYKTVFANVHLLLYVLNSWVLCPVTVLSSFYVQIKVLLCCHQDYHWGLMSAVTLPSLDVIFQQIIREREIQRRTVGRDMQNSSTTHEVSYLYVGTGNWTLVLVDSNMFIPLTEPLFSQRGKSICPYHQQQFEKNTHYTEKEVKNGVSAQALRELLSLTGEDKRSKPYSKSWTAMVKTGIAVGG